MTVIYQEMAEDIITEGVDAAMEGAVVESTSTPEKATVLHHFDTTFTPLLHP